MSYAVFHPMNMWHNPMALLYFNGGYWGYWAGFVVSGMYLYRKQKPLNVPAYNLLLPLFTGITVFYGTYKLLSASILFSSITGIFQGIACYVFAYVLLRYAKEQMLLTYSVFFLLFLFFLSLFQSSSFLFGLSKEQTFYIVFVLSLLLAEKYWYITGKSEEKR